MPRTGTTFLATLAMRNLTPGSIVGQLGYKHGPALDLEDMNEWINKYGGNKIMKERSFTAMKGIVYPLIIIKNPYSWYQSISRFRQNGFNFKSEYRQYNNNYQSWKDLLKDPHKPFGTGIKIKYEDLLINAEKELHRISNETGIEIVSEVVNIPTKVSQSDEFTEERAEFYLGNSNFGLSDELVNNITDIVDWKLMKFYGYTPKK